MPCSDRGEQLDWNLRHYGVEVEDREAAMIFACEACKIIEQDGIKDRMSPGLRAWWEVHKRWDRASSN